LIRYSGVCPTAFEPKGKFVAGNDIFISYSREERSAARHFAESFAREGFSVWWDAALRSGQTFDEVIEQELRAAKAVVVLWSPRSVASRWVRAEATLADRSNKLVPVIIERCTLPIIFELTQAAELSEWNGDTSDPRWETLVSDLRRLVGLEDEAEPLPVPNSAAPNPTRSPAAPKPVQAEAAKEELMASLARIGEAASSDLQNPTPQEEHLTKFYRESDDFRAREKDKVHCLLRLDDDDTETSFVVPSSGLMMGRSAPADIIVTGLGVSRAHCEIELVDGQLRVTDLNSTNGTFIDEQRLTPTAILPKGSILRVGTISFRHDEFPRSEAPRHSAPVVTARPPGITRAANS